MRIICDFLLGKMNISEIYGEFYKTRDGMMLILNTRLNTKYCVRSVLGTTSSLLKLRVDGKVSTGNLALRNMRRGDGGV